ncbi:MAG: hypothetical protein EXS35_08660 [Pedosphaera sp.]|nr:hypothetical protein [Pedosphaera sp.]
MEAGKNNEVRPRVGPDDADDAVHAELLQRLRADGGHVFVADFRGVNLHADLVVEQREVHRGGNFFFLVLAIDGDGGFGGKRREVAEQLGERGIDAGGLAGRFELGERRAARQRQGDECGSEKNLHGTNRVDTTAENIAVRAGLTKQIPVRYVFGGAINGG